MLGPANELGRGVHPAVEMFWRGREGRERHSSRRIHMASHRARRIGRTARRQATSPCVRKAGCRNRSASCSCLTQERRSMVANPLTHSKAIALGPKTAEHGSLANVGPGTPFDSPRQSRADREIQGTQSPAASQQPPIVCAGQRSRLGCMGVQPCEGTNMPGWLAGAGRRQLPQAS